MYWVRRFTYLTVPVLLIIFVATYLPVLLDPTSRGPESRARDRLWVSSSPYFWDRQACRWISLCGLHHLRRDPAVLPPIFEEDPSDELRVELRKRMDVTWEEDAELHGLGSRKARRDLKRNPQERRKILKEVPQYVIDHAPLVHLYSGEQFWPSDIREHIQHMIVTIDHKRLNTTENVTLHNLQSLNRFDNHMVTLHSLEDVESRPKWLHSHDNLPNPFDDPDASTPPPRGNGRKPHNEPDTWFDTDKKHPVHRISDPRRKNKPAYAPTPSPGKEQQRIIPRGHKPDADGYSKAPATLVLVDKGSGIVDAFWFFFYSYNLGQTVLGLRFGNHVGDWEHCMVRFQNGEPRGIFFSEHEGGQAYAWEAIEKRGVRPVIYSAVGSHAMYALPGPHPYVLPFKMLKDVTDKGPLWDPALNNYAYFYDYTLENPEDTIEHEDSIGAKGLTHDTHSFVPAASNPDAPTTWLHYQGRWGDETYTLADPRQWRLFGQYHYVTGPSGPKFKNLERQTLCPARTCRLLYEIDPKGTWY
ncbi:putative vacuolar protein sorting-associated protein TDA6 [Trichoderma asperellum]|uniref:Putative vacuolar protein sorting-associated protein TDA6 n=1 Tax=Trichoderma asperellum TaxID=101201 RepID=A0A6V8QW36_TRIAP|nr:putative vacuolar protein sorting-associated protein TDA6 [Trichoderma asperellum]